MDKKNYRRNKDFVIFIVCTVSFYLFYFVTHTLMYKDGGDLIIHTENASHLSFSELLEFVQRFTYPLYHIATAFVNRVFHISMYDAGVLIVTSFATAAVLVTYNILKKFLEGKYSLTQIGLLTFVLTIVTAFYWPWYNIYVYTGQSSPNIYHSPTQTMVKALAVGICFLFVRYYYDYVNNEEGKKWGSWKKVIILSILLFFSLLAKPSFLQGFLPAVVLFLLIELIISKGKLFRYCVQMGVAFVPSVIYLLYQFLFYYSSESKYTKGKITITFFGFSFD